ncbi:hypothetical protein [Succinivibrio dextrinosolvens]|uniref:Uncharacterized protein n=1 Tax=Succinivibrio dextrinosolvens TaxID=83771 RepID=A0A662Z787_9GAMM|nr:hypothetical protein [Succinivibrio dextrinosolvens]SFJ89064.1 hypothetical protein SAMN04487865_100622 [Succinivibrio dextrinosolvens]
MKYSHSTIQFVKLYMILLILTSCLSIWLYPKQYAAPSASYIKDYDTRRIEIHRNIVKSKTAREMEDRVKNSIQNSLSEKQSIQERERIFSLNQEFARKRGEEIIRERATQGKASDGIVSRDSKMSVAQSRVSSLSEWTRKNMVKNLD